MEWKEVALGDVCTIYGRIGFRGYTTNDLVSSPEDGAISLSPSNMVNGEIDLSKNTYIKWDKYEESPEIKIQKNDILIVKTGSSVGRTALVRDVPHPMTLNPQLVVLKDISINPIFLSYVIKSYEFQGALKGIVVGSAIPTLSQKNLAKLIIQIPNTYIQDKIGDIVSSLDAKIENNNKINANLEAQAAALFKSWFVDFEPFRDGEFVESELGMIPKGWKVGTLDSLCSFISRGMAPKYNDDTNEWILGQTCVRNNIVTLNNARKHLPKTKTEKWVKQWDILLNSTGIGSLGRVGIVYFDKDNVAFDTHITVVRVADPLYRHYVGRNLLSRQLEIENMAVGSTGQTELPKESVKTMPIIIPEGSILEKFNKLIEPIGKMMISNIEENNCLAQTRDTLLPKLMSGEIELSQVKDV